MGRKDRKYRQEVQRIELDCDVMGKNARDETPDVHKRSWIRLQTLFCYSKSNGKPLKDFQQKSGKKQNITQHSLPLQEIIFNLKMKFL